VVVLGAVLHGAGGCSSGGEAAPPAADGGADGVRDAGREAADAGGDALADAGAWSPLLDLNEGRCGLLAADEATAATLSPKWEPCAPVTPHSGAGCRQLKFDWDPPRGLSGHIAASVRAWHAADGTLVYTLGRGLDGDIVRMVVEGETTRTAIRQTTLKCALAPERGYDRRFLYGVTERSLAGNDDAVSYAVLGGTIGERPRALAHYKEAELRGLTGGPKGFILQPSREYLSWEDASVLGKVDLDALDGPLYMQGLAFVGDTLHFNVGNLRVSRQKVWSLGEGTRDLLTYGQDETRGYGDLGTDGKDLVWTQGERVDTSAVYPRLSIATSPYATSTAALKPRILRSDISGYGFGTSTFVVGCGYAARSTFLEPTPGSFVNIVILVRLSDGHAWMLPDDPSTGFAYRTALGLTCDELYALVEIREGDGGTAASHFNVARVRLDSLGPGVPPP